MTNNAIEDAKDELFDFLECLIDGELKKRDAITLLRRIDRLIDLKIEMAVRNLQLAQRARDEAAG